MSQIKLARSANGEHMMCTRVYTLVQTSLYMVVNIHYMQLHSCEHTRQLRISLLFVALIV